MHEGIRNIMETHPDSQYLQGVFDMSSQYLHLTHADNRMQNWSTHVVPADTFVPANVNQVQRIPRRGRGHRRAQHDEAGTSNQGEWAPSHHGEQTPFIKVNPVVQIRSSHRTFSTLKHLDRTYIRRPLHI